MTCRTCSNPGKHLLCTVSLFSLPGSHTTSYTALHSHFSLQMSYLFQLLFTEFVFSFLGLQETVQFFFLLGLNVLLKLLFFIGHHFSLQQIRQQISLLSDGLQLMFHFRTRPRTLGTVITILTMTLNKHEPQELALNSLLIPTPHQHTQQESSFQCFISSALLFS